MKQQIPVQVDVLIVGYGPVGAALACLLGRYGVNTLVIDKAADIFMAPRAIALDNEALRILQMAGVAEDSFEKVAIPFVRMHCPYLGEFGRVNTAGSIDGHPKLVTFYQPELERALRNKAQSHANVCAATGVELDSFEERSGRVNAKLKLSDGTTHQVSARYLVGADGASSKVRTAIGQDFEGKTYAENWLIVDARNVPGNFDHVEFLCDHRRPTPHMVAPGGRIRWEFMLHPGEKREEMERDETIAKLLAPWAKDGKLEIERKAVYTFHARSCDRYSKGSVFLVGDAAHITPPFVGQGLVAGLRDAANLGWKLAWVVRGQAEERILETYDRERRPHATKMIELAKLMGHFIMPRTRGMAVLLHGFMRGLRSIPNIRNFIDELGIKPKAVFESGLFHPGKGHLTRGALLPQGWIRAPSGHTFLSDDALGNQLCVVGFGVDVTTKMSAQTEHLLGSLGGKSVHLTVRGETLRCTHKSYEDLENRLVVGSAPFGWCAIVRPDRTVLHDGPVEDVDRIVREAYALLNGKQSDGVPREAWI